MGSIARFLGITLLFGAGIAAPAVSESQNPKAQGGVASRPTTAAAPKPSTAARVFQMWVHDPTELGKDPRVQSLLDTFGKATQMSAKDRQDAAGFFNAIGKGAKWPMELQVHASIDARPRILFAFFYESATTDLFSELKKSDSKAASRFKKATWRGTPVDYATYPSENARVPEREEGLDFNRGVAAFLKYQGKQLVFFDVARAPLADGAAETAAALDILDAGAPLAPAPSDSLRSQLKGRGIEMVLDVSGLLAMLPAEHPVRQVASAVVGDGFRGLTYRFDVEKGHLVDEGFLDIRAGQGLLGSLFETSSQPPALVRWIPPCSEEFASFRISMAGLTKIGRYVEKLGFPIKPAAWGPNFSWFARVLGNRDPFQILESNLTGEIVFITKPSTMQEARDGDPGETGLFLFGMRDGVGTLDWLRQFILKEGKQAGIQWGDLDRFGVRTITIGGQPAFYAAAKPGLLAVSTAGDENLALLRASLATEGRANLTVEFAERMGRDAMNAPHTFLGIQHILSKIAGTATLSALRGKNVSAAVVGITSMLGTGFGGAKGMFASTVVTTPEGMRFKSVW